MLVTAPDTLVDDASAWQLATKRAPTDGEHLDLDLAWRLVRGVTSNAIVLVRERRLIGIGSGQTTRVDAARQAVEKARAILGHGRDGRAACASDAFYPFPDGVEVCLAAGVTAFVQPGGSMRDAEVVAPRTGSAPRCCSRGCATSATELASLASRPGSPRRTARHIIGAWTPSDAGVPRAALLRAVVTDR